MNPIGRDCGGDRRKVLGLLSWADQCVAGQRAEISAGLVGSDQLFWRPWQIQRRTTILQVGVQGTVRAILLLLLFVYQDVLLPFSIDHQQPAHVHLQLKHHKCLLIWGWTYIVYLSNSSLPAKLQQILAALGYFNLGVRNRVYLFSSLQVEFLIKYFSWKSLPGQSWGSCCCSTWDS